MLNTYMQAEWDTLDQMVLRPRDADEHESSEMKRAFYAGALAYIVSLREDPKFRDMTGEELQERLKQDGSDLAGDLLNIIMPPEVK